MIAKDADSTRSSSKESSVIGFNALIRYIRIQNEQGISYDFEVIPNHPDGNCLFRAISQAVYKRESRHSIVRELVVDYITDVSNWRKFLPFIQAQHDHLMDSDGTRTPASSVNDPDPTSDADPGTGTGTDENGNKNEEEKSSNVDAPAPTDANNNNDPELVQKRPSLQSLKSELKAEIECRTVSRNWKDEYLTYMKSVCTFGTMQELIAAGERFQFNSIVIREIDQDLFNLQNFSEQNWENTNIFYFTGDSDSGHFELLRPIFDEKPIYEIPNGDYKQIGWNADIGLATLRAIPRGRQFDRNNNNRAIDDSSFQKNSTLERESISRIPEEIDRRIPSRVEGKLDLNMDSEVDQPYLPSSPVAKANGEKSEEADANRNPYDYDLSNPLTKMITKFIRKTSKPNSSRDRHSMHRRHHVRRRKQMDTGSDSACDSDDSDDDYSNNSQLGILSNRKSLYLIERDGYPRKFWRTHSEGSASADVRQNTPPLLHAYRERLDRDQKSMEMLELKHFKKKQGQGPGRGSMVEVGQYGQLMMESRENLEKSRVGFKRVSNAAREAFCCLFCPCLYGRCNLD